MGAEWMLIENKHEQPVQKKFVEIVEIINEDYKTNISSNN